MRKYISILTSGLLLVTAVIAFSSCTGNFEKYNRNPDQPGSIDRDVWNYIKTMQLFVIPTVKNQYQVVENVSGGAYGRYFAYAKSSNSDNWDTGMFAFFSIRENWHNPIFENPMNNTYSNWREIVNELDEPESDYRMALAQILRIASMHRLTDMIGPIPYRTMEGSAGLTAAYEPQKDVYGYMIEDLTDAVTVLEQYISLAGSAQLDDENAKTNDLLYRGDLGKWIRYANSLKLRIAMRMSFVDATTAQKHAQDAVAHVYGVITSNSDNAFLDVSSTNDNFPLWWMVHDYKDAHAAAEIVTYMKSFSDPRIAAYFSPAKEDGLYHGSRVGVRSAQAWADQYSWPKAEKSDKLMWMNAAEVAFLKAEMALNDWTVTGTAQENYEEGIRLSFEQWGINSGYATYITVTDTPTNYSDPRTTYSYTIPANPVTVAYNDSADKDRQREQIITQKWIALYPLGHEAWSEQRRTGFPRFYPTVHNNNTDEPTLVNVGPSRIPFVPNERTRNQENYDAAVLLLGPGGDRFGTKLWWDVKTNKPAW